jgi:hypothetical protein
MDPHRFDRFTRALGSGQSRRGMLKSLAGGAVGAALAVVGIGEAAASGRKRSVGNSCNYNSDCASGLCVQESRTRKICHCAGAGDCPAATDACHSAACLPTGYCGFTVNVGAPCNDGLACTTGDVCQADGSCAGAPVVCTALDECHDVGTCDPISGVCSNPLKIDGSACTGGICCGGTCTDDTTTSNCGSCGNSCPAGDLCQSGACVAGDGGAGTCVANTDYCFTGSVTTCSSSASGTPSDSCSCRTKVNGDIFCATGPAVCAPCNTDADCGVGWACLDLGTNCSVCYSDTPTHYCQQACGS